MKRALHYALVISCAAGVTATASQQSGIGHVHAQEMVEECVEMMPSTSLSGSTIDAAEQANDFSACMTDYVTRILMEKNQELHRELSMNREVAFHNEKFSCQDLERETSEPQYTTKWQHSESQKVHHNYDVQVHLDRPASKIHVIPNFATQEECDAMIEAGKDWLQAAAVADGAGGSTVNKVRKANQGHVHFHLDDEDQTIPNVFRRIYAYTHHATGLVLDVAGQETLNSIEYIGRGLNDTNPDHYKPHCDGHCNGREHMEGMYTHRSTGHSCFSHTMSNSHKLNRTGLNDNSSRKSRCHHDYLHPCTRCWRSHQFWPRKCPYQAKSRRRHFLFLHGPRNSSKRQWVDGAQCLSRLRRYQEHCYSLDAIRCFNGKAILRF